MLELSFIITKLIPASLTKMIVKSLEFFLDLTNFCIYIELFSPFSSSKKFKIPTDIEFNQILTQQSLKLSEILLPHPYDVENTIFCFKFGILTCRMSHAEIMKYIELLKIQNMEHNQLKLFLFSVNEFLRHSDGLLLKANYETFRESQNGKIATVILLEIFVYLNEIILENAMTSFQAFEDYFADFGLIKDALFTAPDNISDFGLSNVGCLETLMKAIFFGALPKTQLYLNVIKQIFTLPEA